MKRKIILTIFLFVTLITAVIVMTNKSYSYGLRLDISGSPGSRTLTPIDSSTKTPIAYEDAIAYYGMNKYEVMYQSGKRIYFYMGKEISQSAYERGSSIEEADLRALKYGSNAYRVHTTQEFKNALSDIYNNHRVGSFYIEFSQYEDIDFNEVTQYYQSNFALSHPYQNYYTYQVKGPQEPERFNIDLSQYKTKEEILFTTTNIRISGNEQKVVDAFLNKLLPIIQNESSDYRKILATYTYIVNTTSYLVDDGFMNDTLGSNTSIYDVFINRQSTCIGYSIAFSYIMDKLGIESYIVDNLQEVNTTNYSFYSTHTYNIVKLDNKFYKVDLTGNVFLGGLSSGTLYNNLLPISTSPYHMGLQSYAYDYNTINSYLAAAKMTSTTTTKKAYATTSTKQYPFELPNTTKNNQTTNSTHAPSNNYTPTTTNNQNDLTINSNTNNQNIPNDIPNSETNNPNDEDNYNNISNSNINEQEKPIDENRQTNFNFTFDKKLNYVFIGIIILVIIIYIIYKVLINKNKVSINSEAAKTILDRDIKRDNIDNNDIEQEKKNI